MNYFLGLLVGSLIGSFPTAFLILKKSKNIDITTAGTGNVGAMNSFEVTGSKLIGVSACYGWFQRNFIRSNHKTIFYV